MTCPLCGSAVSKPLCKGVGYPAWSPERPRPLIVELCLECGLAYQPAALASAYQDEAEQGYQVFDKNRLFAFPRRSAENLRTLDAILSALDCMENVAAPNVLEIGANRGDMLAMVKEARPEANVLGMDPARCDLAPMPVVRAPFDPGLLTPCFHLVVLQHVLEHLPDPVPFLQGVASVLAPGGAIYVEVPHLENALAQRVDDFSVEHACYYTPSSLGRVLDKAGLALSSLDQENFLRVTARAGSGAIPESDATRLLDLVQAYVRDRERWSDYLRQQARAGRRVVFFGIAFYFQCLFKEFRADLDPTRCAFLDDEFLGDIEPSFGLPRTDKAGPGDLVLLCSPNPRVQECMARTLVGCEAEILRPWRGPIGQEERT